MSESVNKIKRYLNKIRSFLDWFIPLLLMKFFSSGISSKGVFFVYPFYRIQYISSFPFLNVLRDCFSAMNVSFRLQIRRNEIFFMNSMQEGIIKFTYTLLDGPTIPLNTYNSLESVRKILYDLELIGEDKNGLGYGNLSMILDNSENRMFAISGSQTGGLHHLQREHYVTITECQFENFTLHASGKINPSSETLTHAAIYAVSNAISCVIHIHSKPMWDFMLTENYPATDAIAYGTKEMVEEVRKMFLANIFNNKRIFAMKGHESGIISFGNSAQETLNEILDLYKRVFA